MAVEKSECGVEFIYFLLDWLLEDAVYQHKACSAKCVTQGSSVQLEKGISV